MGVDTINNMLQSKQRQTMANKKLLEMKALGRIKKGESDAKNRL
jgi:hypothetical protein